ncbi:MAG: hypothetical protein AAGG07_10135 [Planctomycetota bacterium]
MTSIPSGYHGPASGPDRASAIRARLRSLRERARFALVCERSARLLWITLLTIALGATADYLLRLPAALRVVLLLGGAAVLGVLIVKRLLPAWRFRPSLTDIALRVEGRDAVEGGRGLIASAVELGSFEGGPVDGPMAREAVRRASEAMQRFSETGLVRFGPLRNALLRLTAVVAVLVVVASVAPTYASIGVRRVLTPWSAVDWPQRTSLEDATAIEAHPIDVPLMIRGLLTRTPREPGRTQVEAVYRVDAPGGGSGERRRVSLSPRGVTDDGEVYERLIEPAVAGADEVTLRYRLSTFDDETEERRVLLVRRPEIVGATATITPPAYASGEGSELSGFVSGGLDLGDGGDRRALIGPVLAGSGVEIELRFNKPLGVPDNTALALGLDDSVEIPLTVRSDDQANTWRLAFDADAPITLRPVIEDEHGIASLDEPAFVFDVVADAPPAVAIAEPVRDESVLVSAEVPVRGTATDDVGVKRLALRASIHGAAQGEDEESISEPVLIAERTVAGLNAEVSSTLSVSSLGAEPGQTIVLEAVASDALRADGVASSPRRLRVIDEAAFVERIRSELTGVRRGVREMDADQSALARRVQAGSVGPRTAADQSALTDRAEAQREVVERLSERVETNKLDDAALRELLDRAGRMLASAATSSSEARSAIDRASDGDSPADRRQADRDSARDAQERVRDELGRLAGLLDQGEDAWAARRGVERLRDELERVREATQRLGEQTVGRELDELSEQERAEAAELAERQEELAQRAEEVLDELSEQARNLRGSDEAQASALAQAAQRGRSQQLAEQIQRASEQTGQNQTAQAQQSQEQAAEALEQMIQDLDEAEQRRDETLRRLLADIMDAIRNLVERQEAQLAALDAAREDGGEDAWRALATPMIDLHRATAALAEDARSRSNELAPVAGELSRAGDEMVQAIVVLRGGSIAYDDVEGHEREALRRLERALDEAQNADDDAAQREQDRARDALKRAYSEALAEQREIAEASEALAARRLNRRERRDAIALAERQAELRVRLASLLEETEGLAEATVFAFAHERLDAVTGRAAEGLRATPIGPGVAEDQASAARTLGGLVQALDEEPPPEFRERGGEQGGGGGQGGGGSDEDELLPPIAELKLLRALQLEAIERTTAADRAREAGEDGRSRAVAAEAASIQRRLGDEAQAVLERLQEQNGGGGGPAPQIPPQDDGGFGYAALEQDGSGRLEPPQDERAGADAPAPERAQRTGSALPSLDELLGITSPDASDAGEDDLAREDLERALTQRAIADDFAQAIDLMDRAADRLEDRSDTSLVTRRLQQDALDRLDTLIENAERQQSQQQSNSQSSSGDPQQSPPTASSQQQGQQSQQSGSGEPGEGERSSDTNAQLNPIAQAAEAAWGALPQRVRDSLVQGAGEQFSETYRELTETYYRRLAEERE